MKEIEILGKKITKASNMGASCAWGGTVGLKTGVNPSSRNL